MEPSVLAPLDPRIYALHDGGRAWLGDDVLWFDAHTHIGQNDPDGVKGSAAELLANLDEAGQDRALVFAMHEPGGYPPANAAVLEAVAASDGRLLALTRVDPKAAGALEHAREQFERGARGIKLHPRSDAFGLPHPVVAQLVELAAEHRAPVLFHAGRGIPHLGESVVELARANPDARLILAHAGISDLGWIGPAATELQNIFFDTSWWQIWDLLTLFTTIPPGRILYASDSPYARSSFTAMSFLRVARAAGLSAETTATIAGRQLANLLAGDDPLELGPAPGVPHEPRRLGHERVVAYLTAALLLLVRGNDATEALSLARLACQTPDDDDPLLAFVDGLIATTLSAQDAPPAVGLRRPGIYELVAAQIVAGTPDVPI